MINLGDEMETYQSRPTQPTTRKTQPTQTMQSNNEPTQTQIPSKVPQQELNTHDATVPNM